MNDERIQSTANRFGARGFFIWKLLLAISLLYRSLILKQDIREYWDIFAIFCFGIIFVSVACANKGVFDHGFKWRLSICIGTFIGILTVQFIAGRIPSVVDMGDVGGLLIGFIFGMGLAIAIAYFLNRRWKRKEGIEDEE